MFRGGRRVTVNGWLRLLAAIVAGSLATGCVAVGSDDDEVGQPTGPQGAEPSERAQGDESTLEEHDEQPTPCPNDSAPVDAVTGDAPRQQLPDGEPVDATTEDRLLPVELLAVDPETYAQVTG